MRKQLEPGGNTESASYYHIRLQGHLSPQWADWFHGLDINLEENGETVLSGSVSDQAALHGIFKKIRDIGMPLISVNSQLPGQAKSSDSKK